MILFLPKKDHIIGPPLPDLWQVGEA